MYIYICVCLLGFPLYQWNSQFWCEKKSAIIGSSAKQQLIRQVGHPCRLLQRMPMAEHMQRISYTYVWIIYIYMYLKKNIYIDRERQMLDICIFVSLYVYIYIWAAVKINCLCLVQKYKLSLFGGALSLSNVLFKSTRNTAKMRGN